MRLRNCAMVALAVVVAMMLTACGGGSDTAASQAAGGDGGASTSEQTFNLKLNYGPAEDHAMHIQMTTWAEAVKKRFSGIINVQILPSGQLGSKTDNVSSTQAGAPDMVEVPVLTLGSFNEARNALSVPYVLNGKDHYHKVMDGKIVRRLYNITEGDDFIGLTWLDSGSRSFYTANTPIRVPANLKGLKIRTMDSQITINMMSALGGSAAVASYLEIYTGLQQGIINGAENNITALHDHSDVTGYYCYNEYTRIPDVIVISTKVWSQMSDSQKDIMKEATMAAISEYKTRWTDFENEVRTVTKRNSITFVEDVGTVAFQEVCQSIYDGLKTSNTGVYAIVEKTRAVSRWGPVGCCCLLHEGNGILKKSNDFLDAVMRFIMAAVMLTLLAGGTWQIFAHWILGSPSTSTGGLLRYVLIWASMLGFAHCSYKDGRLALDLVRDRVRGLMRLVLMILIEAVILFFVCYVFIYGGMQLAGNVTSRSFVTRISFKLLYTCLLTSGIFIVITRVIKYIQLFTDSKGGK